jgi:glutaredoxin
MKLELFYFDECPYCQIVLEVIDDQELNSKVTLCNVRKNPQQRDRHLKTTGRTTVPCLYIDDKPMFESRDIARWLEANRKKIIDG